jgi:uncharacterized protein with PIN domain
MTQAHARGPVEILGVTTRTSTTSNRRCEGCGERVREGERYERVARIPQQIESYHEECFGDEFGPREAYGD